MCYMTDFQLFVTACLATTAALVLVVKKFYMPKDFTEVEYLPELPTEPSDSQTPPYPPVTTQSTPQEPYKTVEVPPTLLWDTPKHAWKSVRMICDDMGLTYDQKNEICYTIWGESGFNIKAVGKQNKNGTKDFGICQYNNGTNAKGVPFWIGEGATFASVDEVLNNPEKCVRVMIKTYLAGNIRWWYGHEGYSLTAVEKSPMWQLKGV